MNDQILINQSQKISFVMIDTAGAEVAGLGTTFSVAISKNGGAFAAGVGTKTEIGSGWYTYTVTATEADTAGPLAVKITGAGAVQQNLLFQVTGTLWSSIPSLVTLGELKSYLGITTSDDDDLLTSLLARAQEAVESYCNRVFEWSGDATTRYYTVGKDTAGAKLYLDEDLCAITSIVTNADNGSGGTTLATTDYVTHPRNKTPYWCIEIVSSSSESWDYTSDPTGGISVTGKWAYSETPPADIAHACIRMAAYVYRQKDAQVFDVTAMPDAGVMMIPKGIPADVKMLLDPYRKRTL